MKLLLFHLIFLLSISASNNLHAQDKNSLFVTFGYSNTVPVYNQDVDGGGSFKGKTSSSIGLRYLRKGRKAIGLETGIDYGFFNYERTPSFYPGTDMMTRLEKLNLITVPIYANLTFFKYLFVQGGALLDIELNKKNSIQRQSGLGFGLGAGGKVNIGHFTLMLNPFLQKHAWIPFEKKGTRQSLMNSGVRIGVGYCF